jgi:hypothetical protein
MGMAQTQNARAIAVGGGHGEAGMVTARMDDMDIEQVKGVPFCATVATEHTQTFADGNRIHTVSDNSNLCRDSLGRTRREASLNLLGAAPQPSPPKLVTISDPVSGFRYMLDSDNKIAHRFAINSPGAKGAGPDVAAAGAMGAKGEHVMIYQRVGPAGPNMVQGDNVFFKRAGQVGNEPAPTTENLGDQTIDGIHATGTRMTTTIPAGTMGNEQPILITSERWYSPELKANVMTKHNDPWAGELKTQLTNVSTSEPDSSLFVVPSDYKVVDEKAGPFVLQKHLPPLPAPPE